MRLAASFVLNQTISSFSPIAASVREPGSVFDHFGQFPGSVGRDAAGRGRTDRPWAASGRCPRRSRGGSTTTTTGGHRRPACSPRAVPFQEGAPRGTRQPAHELSFALPPDRAVGGHLQVGEQVAVLATFGTGTDARTELVAPRALVLAVERAPGGLDGSGVLLTVAVDDPDD